jgi:thioredoxin reductase
VLEQDSIGGTIYHYPRRKLVLTAPVELPLWGTLKTAEIVKEDLLDIWTGIVEEFDLDIRTGRRVASVTGDETGFTVTTEDGEAHAAGSVVLAIGRRGSPRKLGVPGEDQPKVTYRLIDAEGYTDSRLLVVGGGDSAVEAAVGLARQSGNLVTLSYRREAFVRLKEKNEERVTEFIRSGRIEAALGTTVKEIGRDRVVLSRGDGADLAMENDYVFIFAGGVLPTALLREAGIRLRTGEQDVQAA